MGRRIKCPYCGHEFYIHGYEEMANCYECNSMFNPREQSDIPEGDTE